MSGAGPDLADPAVSTTADPVLESTDYTIPVIVAAIAGFLLLTCSMAVCYAKRWLCFAVSAVQLAVRLGNPECSFTLIYLQCRGDYPEDPMEMSGPRIAEAYRNDVNNGRLLSVLRQGGQKKSQQEPS